MGYLHITRKGTICSHPAMSNFETVIINRNGKKQNAFILLEDINKVCRRADLLLRLKVTHAIHHVWECSTAPKEPGMLPNPPQAIGNRHQAPAAHMAWFWCS